MYKATLEIRSNYLIIFFILSTILYSQDLTTSIKNLSIDSDLIVTGKVIDKTSQWSSDKSKIYTDVRLSVDNYIKGFQQENSIVVRCLGGEIDGIGEKYSHVPTFEMSEEVLLFLKKDNSRESSNYSVAGGEEGKITLIGQVRNDEERKTRDRKAELFKREIKKVLDAR